MIGSKQQARDRERRTKKKSGKKVKVIEKFPFRFSCHAMYTRKYSCRAFAIPFPLVLWLPFMRIVFSKGNLCAKKSSCTKYSILCSTLSKRTVTEKKKAEKKLEHRTYVCTYAECISPNALCNLKNMCMHTHLEFINPELQPHIWLVELHSRGIRL